MRTNGQSDRARPQSCRERAQRCGAPTILESKQKGGADPKTENLVGEGVGIGVGMIWGSSEELGIGRGMKRVLACLVEARGWIWRVGHGAKAATRQE